MIRPPAAAAPHVNEPTCHGCKNTLYSAPGGQSPHKPFPHSRCTALSRDIPMVVDKHEKWLASEVPSECPMRSASRRDGGRA